MRRQRGRACNFVPVKSAEQQAAAMILSVRELLVKQRTQLVNAVRGHAAEFGVIAAKGTGQVEPLLERVADDPAVPEPAGAMFAVLGGQIAELSVRLAALDRDLAAAAQGQPGEPAAGGDTRRRPDRRADAGADGRCLAVPLGAALRRLARADAEAELDRRASRGWAGSRARATNGCASCWCSAPPPWSALSNRAAGTPAPGCWGCCSAGRASSRRWLWPTRWPVSCGP